MSDISNDTMTVEEAFEVLRLAVIYPKLRDHILAYYGEDSTEDCGEALERILAQLAQAREALQPFGQHAEAFDRAEQAYGDGPVFVRTNKEAKWSFTIADVRRASRALEQGAEDG